MSAVLSLARNRVVGFLLRGWARIAGAMGLHEHALSFLRVSG
jgi:hypothetical protein